MAEATEERRLKSTPFKEDIKSVLNLISNAGSRIGNTMGGLMQYPARQAGEYFAGEDSNKTQSAFEQLNTGLGLNTKILTPEQASQSLQKSKLGARSKLPITSPSTVPAAPTTTPSATPPTKPVFGGRVSESAATSPVATNTGPAPAIPAPGQPWTQEQKDAYLGTGAVRKIDVPLEKQGEFGEIALTNLKDDAEVFTPWSQRKNQNLELPPEAAGSPEYQQNLAQQQSITNAQKMLDAYTRGEIKLRPGQRDALQDIAKMAQTPYQRESIGVLREKNRIDQESHRLQRESNELMRANDLEERKRGHDLMQQKYNLDRQALTDRRDVELTDMLTQRTGVVETDSVTGEKRINLPRTFLSHMKANTQGLSKMYQEGVKDITKQWEEYWTQAQKMGAKPNQKAKAMENFEDHLRIYPKL
jgi:hypothetical protein